MGNNWSSFWPFKIKQPAIKSLKRKCLYEDDGTTKKRRLFLYSTETFAVGQEVTFCVPLNFVVPSNLSVLKKAELVHILYRQEYGAIVTGMETASQNYVYVRRLVQGPAGVGKSTALLYAVCCGLQHGWVVIYLHDLKSYVGKDVSALHKSVRQFLQSQYEQSAELLRQQNTDWNAQCALHTLESYFSAEIWTNTLEKDVEYFERYMTYVAEITAVPVLIAVDELNAILPHKTDPEKDRQRLEDLFITKILRSFIDTQSGMSRGVFLYANTAALVDCVAPRALDSNVVYVNRMDKLLALQVFDFYKKKLSVNGDGANFDRVYELTNGITDIMIVLLARKRAVPSKSWAVIYEECRQSATKYYRDRIRKLFQRISETDVADLEFIVSTLSIRFTATIDDPQLFKAAGVLDEFGKPVNNSLMRAVATELKSFPKTLDYLFTVQTCRGHALEAAFFSEWLRGAGRCVFNTKFANGSERPERITLAFKEVCRQCYFPLKYEDQDELVEGRLWELTPRHAGLDFIGLSQQLTPDGKLGGEQVLILGQLSVTPYDGRAHNIDKLRRSTHKMTSHEKPYWSVEDLNLMQFYALCMYPPNGRRNKVKELRKDANFHNSTLPNIRYVYITTSSCASCVTEPDPDIYVIDGDELRKTFRWWPESAFSSRTSAAASDTVAT